MNNLFPQFLVLVQIHFYAAVDRKSIKAIALFLRYPTQKEWERKEQLYLNVIDLLERGKHWEHAIPLTKELADVYERRVFNYRKLVSFVQSFHYITKLCTLRLPLQIAILHSKFTIQC